MKLVVKVYAPKDPHHTKILCHIQIYVTVLGRRGCFIIKSFINYDFSTEIVNHVDNINSTVIFIELSIDHKPEV